MDINLDNLDSNTAKKIGGVAGSIAQELVIQNQKINELVDKLQATEKMAQSKRLKDFEEMTQDYIELRQKLLDFPAMIKEQKENIYGLEEYVQQTKEEVELLEGVKMQEIQNATDRGGKKKYSNGDARDAAMKIWQKENEDYKAAKAALKSSQRDLENAKFDLDRIYNDYKSTQKIADMMTARMNMFIS